jgi:chromatin remodeling complex protein RSC6
MTETATMNVDATTTETETTENTIDTFFEKLEELNALTKWFNRQGRAIIRKSTKTRRRNANTNAKSGFAVPVRVASTLAEFLNVDPNDHMPRTEVTKRLTEYIKSNSLQCEDNKKLFVCDEKLAKVFSIDAGTQTNWFEMQKFLAKLLTSVKKDEAKDGDKDVAPPAPAVTKQPAAEAPAPTEAPKKKLKKSA